jgi:hypothetical protein
MSEDCMIAFIQEIPTFEMCHSRLYDQRKKFIPRASRSQAELDTKSAWFSSDNGEHLAKIDTTLSNGKRIVGITSNAALAQWGK